MKTKARELASFAGFCLLVAAAITGFTLLAARWRGWPTMFGAVAANVVMSFAIGGLCWATLPRVARRVCHWQLFNRWTALLVSMIAAAAGGTAIAVLLARGFGIGESATALYLATLRTSVPITILVGVIVTLLEVSKARLADTELALRTQQVERERAEKLAAEAQLASLAARVHPHFLFNTLNSIAALVRDDPARAEQMIERLSSLLRGSLDATDAIPVEREMKLVADYLDIQRMRLGDRLRHRIVWRPEETNGATVPPFAVQSLVENSVKHVAGRRQEGVEVQVGARTERRELVIEVADNGPGFDAGSISVGRGLDNLQGRLRALYGERARVEFDRLSPGMRVRLRIPAP
jgi:signal transduction histidine kinase